MELHRAGAFFLSPTCCIMGAAHTAWSLMKYISIAFGCCHIYVTVWLCGVAFLKSLPDDPSVSIHADFFFVFVFIYIYIYIYVWIFVLLDFVTLTWKMLININLYRISLIIFCLYRFIHFCLFVCLFLHIAEGIRDFKNVLLKSANDLKRSEVGLRGLMT